MRRGPLAGSRRTTSRRLRSARVASAALGPALRARRVKAWVLLALADNDIFIPWAQQREFADRHPGYTDVLRLPVGQIVWLRGASTAKSFGLVAQAQLRLTVGVG